LNSVSATSGIRKPITIWLLVYNRVDMNSSSYNVKNSSERLSALKIHIYRIMNYASHRIKAV
jgi:hypothetical protein